MSKLKAIGKLKILAKGLYRSGWKSSADGLAILVDEVESEITQLEADKAELLGTLISIRATQALVGDLTNLDELIKKHKSI